MPKLSTNLNKPHPDSVSIIYAVTVIKTIRMDSFFTRLGALSPASINLISKSNY